MPHVMNDTEILEQLARSLEADTAELQTPVLPLPRRGPDRLVAALRRLITLPWSARTPRRQRRILHTHEQFEMPTDILAREHPFLYIKSLCG
jgi:hypothetical protein